jgi:hypothetical protein
MTLGLEALRYVYKAIERLAIERLGGDALRDRYP